MAALGQSIRRSAIGLGLFAVFTGGTIAITQALTADRIQLQVARAEARALYEIIPESLHNNDMLNDTVVLPADERFRFPQPVNAWVARVDDSAIGLILPVVAPDGYSGNIQILVGVSLSGDVLGVRVTGHKETPGLGDKVELKKSNWVLDFNGRSLDNPGLDGWTVAKNGGVFDQFTGATITPKAVTGAVRNALLYLRAHESDVALAVATRTAQESP
ncbi:electron transport complex subunit RsxG [Marinobacter mobilis]|uniref:Ion-translocating oxidoreductase complex subunit G n=1 Tax=Marinobacter mobilis TaxID=488533 RepID=A0A1H2UA77_9GAMM|nr:electron transport complex subunit RsxG [Marinobacter mobilis]SDW52877.1 electron transport complex protein RnfG [Marinobacter mobilis]